MYLTEFDMYENSCLYCCTSKKAFAVIDFLPVKISHRIRFLSLIVIVVFKCTGLVLSCSLTLCDLTCSDHYCLCFNLVFHSTDANIFCKAFNTLSLVR